MKSYGIMTEHIVSHILHSHVTPVSPPPSVVTHNHPCTRTDKSRNPLQTTPFNENASELSTSQMQRVFLLLALFSQIPAVLTCATGCISPSAGSLPSPPAPSSAACVPAPSPPATAPAPTPVAPLVAAAEVSGTVAPEPFKDSAQSRYRGGQRLLGSVLTGCCYRNTFQFVVP